MRNEIPDETTRDAAATALPAAEGTVRYMELDALRGVAALSVVIAHFSGLWDEHHMSRLTLAIYAGPLQLIKAGNSAVVLFFILSGFVLALPKVAGKPQPYRVFITRRITRVYLPYLAALFLAILGDRLFRRNIYINPWFARTWTGPVDWHLVGMHVLMLGSYRWSEYNTAFWTLVYEMRVSVVFPFLALAVIRNRWIGIAAIVVCLIAEALLASPPDSHWMYPLSAFIVGILFADHRQRLQAWYRSLSRNRVRTLTCASLLAYAYAGYMSHLPQLLRWAGTPLMLAGAAFLVLGSFSDEVWKGMLRYPALQWLGHVSYSMYLVHGTILWSLVHLLYGRMPLLAILPVYLLAVFALSRLFYGVIERPTMELGRRLTTKKLIACNLAGSAAH